MVYRSCNEAPNYIASLFERLSQNTVRELLNSKTDLKLPLPETSSGPESFSYKGSGNWNNLIDNVKKVPSQNHFRKSYKIRKKSFL